MVTMGVFPFQEKTHMVEPGIENGTSWLVVRNSDHQATRLVILNIVVGDNCSGPSSGRFTLGKDLPPIPSE